MDFFIYFELQKRSRVTELGAQTQHRVIQWFLPPFSSKQSEIRYARDESVVFSNIGQAISLNIHLSFPHPHYWYEVGMLGRLHYYYCLYTVLCTNFF